MTSWAWCRFATSSASGGVDDDQVPQADGAHQAIAADVAVEGILEHHFALDAVAFLVGLGQPTQGFPRADVTPADVTGNDGGPPGVLHHGIVDRVGGNLGKAIRREFDLGESVALEHLPFDHSGPGPAQDARRAGREFREHVVGGKAEHARIPEVTPLAAVLLRELEVGFLDKRDHVVAFMLDVAVAGFGVGGTDAEGDQAVVPGNPTRPVNGRDEGRPVVDQVVGRQDEQLRPGAVVSRHPLRCRGDCRRRVARLRLDHEVTDESGRGRVGDGLAGITGLEQVFPIRHDEDVPNVGEVGATQERLLQQAFSVGQFDEGLGMQPAGDRPQSRAGPPAKDHRNQRAFRCHARHYYAIHLCLRAAGPRPGTSRHEGSDSLPGTWPNRRTTRAVIAGPGRAFRQETPGYPADARSVPNRRPAR